MMRIDHVKPINKKNRKWFAVAVAVMIALLATAFGTFIHRERTAPQAASANSVTVHIYDPNSQYSSWGVWAWVEGSDGSAYSPTTSSGEQFKAGSNTARIVTITVTDAQRTALNNGSKRLGLLVCPSNGGSGGFWDSHSSETGDVMVNLSGKFTTSGADVYYIRKEGTAYTNLQEAINALNNISGVRFTALTSSSVTIGFDAYVSLSGTSVSVLKNGSQFTTGTVQQSGGSSCTVTLSALNGSNFDFGATYSVKLSINGKQIEKAIAATPLLDSSYFISNYETSAAQDAVLGATYTKQSTTFRLWAPLAASVSVKLYAEGGYGSALATHPMQKKTSGLWELVLSGDHCGEYYTYLIDNKGAAIEAMDPYAKACGANGNRAMIVDLKATDPDGWTNDKHLYVNNYTNADTPIVWEVSVNDFSSSPDSGMKYKGKYLAFTEENTTVPGKASLKTGVNYLKDLGITYVHLNPVYDFATVDEAEMSKADNTKDSYNWGYDPQNYNIPEGSYSTDPANGAVRITEFKRMVMALHKAGIGVIMDVVYNHTYSTSGQALHDTVPYYYHRTNNEGYYTNASGCGNETASERTMMRKYIVESVKYWAEEYHIDGFRFDLMGVHDLETIAAVRSALDKLNNNTGASLLMYGEPWSADGSYVPPSYTNRVKATSSASGTYARNTTNNKLIKNMFAGYNNDYPRNMSDLPARVAVFNDSGREGLRGDNSPGKGWANGGSVTEGRKGILRMLEGGIGDSGTGMYTGAGSRNVAYAAAHDNYTLWDQLIGARFGNESALSYDVAHAETVKRAKLVASVYLMSPGISFMLAGDEMGRTKYGNENSYNSPVKINQITWSRQAEFNSLRTYYKNLIALRKQYSTQLFSYTKCTDTGTSSNFCYGSFSNHYGDDGAFTFTRTKNSATLTMTLNPTTLTGSVRIGSTSYSI
ncbi:MAG: hypothetical protein J1G01_03060 [Clostridiales bacterium]|nr:hypothetical protein [Clostridiales bacterium]